MPHYRFFGGVIGKHNGYPEVYLEEYGSADDLKGMQQTDGNIE